MTHNPRLNKAPIDAVRETAIGWEVTCAGQSWLWGYDAPIVPTVGLTMVLDKDGKPIIPKGK